MRGPQAIAFDSLGTLFSTRAAARVLDEAAGKGAFKEWLARVLRDGFALAAAGRFASFEEVARGELEGFLRERGLARGRGHLARALFEAFGRLDAYPDAAPALAEARRRGARVLVLSSGSAALTRKLLERGGLSSGVEIVISIDDVGLWKPAPRIYQAAAGRCGAAPRELALVTAHAWDAQGALAAGLRAAFVAREEPCWPGFLARPEACAGDLTEAVEALASPGLAARVRQLLARP